MSLIFHRFGGFNTVIEVDDREIERSKDLDFRWRSDKSQNYVLLFMQAIPGHRYSAFKNTQTSTSFVTLDFDDWDLSGEPVFYEVVGHNGESKRHLINTRDNPYYSQLVDLTSVQARDKRSQMKVSTSKLPRHRQFSRVG